MGLPQPLVVDFVTLQSHKAKYMPLESQANTILYPNLTPETRADSIPIIFGCIQSNSLIFGRRPNNNIHKLD